MNTIDIFHIRNERGELRATSSLQRAKVPEEILEQIELSLRYSHVALANLVQGGGAQAMSSFMGSGVLARVGHVHGILTAAHVLQNGADSEGNVQSKTGLMTYTRSGDQRQLPALLQRSRDDRIVFASKSPLAASPDIGFLRFSEEFSSSLKARCTFVDLEINAKRLRSGKFSGSAYIDGLSGTLTDKISEPVFDRASVIQRLDAVFNLCGDLKPVHQRGAFDVCEMNAAERPGPDCPTSYNGGSGGGVWRVFYSKGEGRLHQHLLIGIAFSEANDGWPRIIHFHGPNGISGRMVDAIRKKWPCSSE